MQRLLLALWNTLACIAIRVGVVMGLQMFRPYGAGSGLRCSCIMTSPQTPLLTGEGSAIRKLYRGLKSPLSGEI